MSTYAYVTDIHVYSKLDHSELRFVNQEVRVGTRDPRESGNAISSNPICDTMPLDTPCTVGHYIFHCGSVAPLQGRYVTINLAADTLDPENPNLLVLSEVKVYIDPSTSTGQNTCLGTGKNIMDFFQSLRYSISFLIDGSDTSKAICFSKISVNRCWILKLLCIFICNCNWIFHCIWVEPYSSCLVWSIYFKDFFKNNASNYFHYLPYFPPPYTETPIELASQNHFLISQCQYLGKTS